MRYKLNTIISIFVLLFLFGKVIKAVNFESATTICGAGAIEITFSEEIDPGSIVNIEFKVQAQGSSLDRIPVAGVYVNPFDHTKVVVYMTKQALRWVPDAIAYKNIYISYQGSTLKTIKGDQVPTFSLMDVQYVDILNNSNEYIKPLPENFDFEQELWGKNQSSWVLTDTIHVDNKNSIASDDNDGSSDAPLTTITRAITLADAGTVVFVHNGIYPESIKIPRTQPATVSAPFILEGENVDSVMVYGNDDWSDSTWVQNDHYYTCNWPYDWGLNFDANTVPNKLGRHRENVYINNEKYDQVLSVSQLKAKTYFVSNDENKIYLQFPFGITPEMVKIEVSTRSEGITAGDPWNPKAWGGYFVIRNIQFSYFNNLNTIMGKHFLVENCRFQWNNDIGLWTGGEDYLIRKCEISHNGRSGIDIPPRVNSSNEYFSINGLIENCELNNNNWRVGIYGGQRGWFLGGAKIHGIFNIIVRGCSFNNNAAPGLWMDNKVNNALVEDCIFANNSETGIWSEICYGNTVIRNNTITKNNTGINLSNTGYLRAEGNLIIDNKYGQIDSWEPNQNREEAFKTIYPTFKLNAMFGQTIYNIPRWASLYNTINVDSNYYENRTANSFNGMTLASWVSKIQKAQNNEKLESHSLTDKFSFRDALNFDFIPDYHSELANSPDWAFVNIVFINDSTFALESNKPDIEIRFNIDGFLPIKTSPIYSEPIVLRDGQVLAARAYRIINGINTIYSPVSFAVNAQQLNEVQLEIIGQKELFTYENTPLLVKNSDIIVNNDAFLVLLPGENYTVKDNVVTPGLDFIGDLYVPAKVIGFNGALPSESYSLHISVLQNTVNSLYQNEINELNIYPNPCRDKLHIDLNSGSENGKICIYNSEGQLVFNKNIENRRELSINTKSLKTGVYYLNISSRNKPVQCTKFIRQ